MLPPSRFRPRPRSIAISADAPHPSGRLSWGVKWRRTSVTGANAETTRETGAITSRSRFPSRHWARIGKDSLSMRAQWRDGKREREVIAPVSLVVSAFAPVTDVRLHLTPQLRRPDGCGASALIAIDLGRGRNRLGGSIVAQVTQQAGSVAPDLDHPEDLQRFFTAIQQLAAQRRLLAYHDRSDGGLWATICERAFAGHVGVSLNVDLLTLEHGHESDYGDAKNWARQVVGRREERTLRGLFAEELGA